MIDLSKADIKLLGQLIILSAYERVSCVTKELMACARLEGSRSPCIDDS